MSAALLGGGCRPWRVSSGQGAAGTVPTLTVTTWLTVSPSSGCTTAGTRGRSPSAAPTVPSGRPRRAISTYTLGNTTRVPHLRLFPSLALTWVVPSQQMIAPHLVALRWSDSHFNVPFVHSNIHTSQLFLCSDFCHLFVFTDTLLLHWRWSSQKLLVKDSVKCVSPVSLDTAAVVVHNS